MNEETLQVEDRAETGGDPLTEATVSNETCPAAERRTTLQDAAPGVPAIDSGPVESPSDALDRIASHPELPPALRERLAELVQRQPPEPGPTMVSLDGVLALLAETIPSQLRLAAGELPIAPHPEGESFFTGDAASDADKHAAAVASEQLALSGLLRKP